MDGYPECGPLTSEMHITHVYYGDRLTDPGLRGVRVRLVRRQDGRAIVGKRKALFETADGRRFVGLLQRCRRLR